ncbi:hypothetical protein [Streptomyces sp. NPDC047981]|uniref:hypothetical protein n=1 Tax=Streptomyces sp. NPDC047981 TaxID=3154610 RepID=UPI0034258E7D
MTWTLVERAETPKGPTGPGEDRLLIAGDPSDVTCCAVVDGATDKSGRDYGGMSGGSRAADQVIATLTMLPATATPSDALAMVTAGLAALRRRWGIESDDLLGPSAVAAVLLAGRRQIVRVGDVHVGIGRDGVWEYHPADKDVDRAAAGARAALLHCLLAQGADPARLAATDPGRHMVSEILTAQNALANRDDASPFGFGLLDGRPVPRRHVEVFDLDDTVDEVVLASDGYLRPAPTLETAERELAADLAADPLRIGAHPSTKGVAPGSSSFDDRTWVRLRAGRGGGGPERPPSGSS